MELPLKLKKTIILLLTVSVIALLLLVGGSTIGTFREVLSLWQAHRHDATLHITEINQIRRQFGYGGLTYHFNTYLLHRDVRSRERTEEALAALMQALSKAEKLHLSPLERLAVAEIRRTAELYREKYLHARALIAAGSLPHEIAPQVAVDDSSALDAFRLLSDVAVQRERMAAEAAGKRIRSAIDVVLWGALLLPLILLLSLLLWRFLNQVFRANKELERVGWELDAILANAPDAMLYVLSSGEIIRANDQASRLFGYSTGELVNMKIEALVPESIRSEHERYRDAFLYDEGDPHRAAQGRLLTAVTRDGTEVPVEIGLSILRQGSESRAIATIRDVTERMRAQREIEQLNDSLKTQNEELEAFSYSVSHDLRTPLRSIEGFSQLVEKRYAERLDTTGIDYLQRIRRATVRMGDLIDDLLQLSRVSRTEIKPRYINLSAMAEEVLQANAESEPERKVEWEVEPELHTVADPVLLRAVLENLLGNAWKYSATREQARITVSAAEQDGEAVFCVRDNGVGFDMRYADKLFGAFQRLHGPEEFEGTGIGLSTVQRIVQRHGGRIWAESEPDRGARFYFTLGKVDQRVISG